MNPTHDAGATTVDVVPDDPAGIELAATRLAAGGLVVVPTETVYGLGANASDPAAVLRIFQTKGRPVDHPLIVHLDDREHLDRWAARVPKDASRLAERFWPGPLTLIVPRADHVPSVVTGGRETVGLRVPNHASCRAVIRHVPGGGIAAPSANRFGKVSPTTAAHVVEELGPYLDPARDLILDGGPCSVGLESTIVDCTTDPPMLLRPGAISADQLAETLSGRLERVARGPSRAPGMLAAHYAPNAVVEIVDEQTAIARVQHYAGARIALLAPIALAIAGVTRLDAPVPYTPEAIAPLLYARLREADTLGFDVLLVVPPDQAGVGAAVLDRLTRAAVGSTRAAH